MNGSNGEIRVDRSFDVLPRNSLHFTSDMEDKQAAEDKEPFS
jgi:hypothetical protein